MLYIDSGPSPRACSCRPVVGQQSSISPRPWVALMLLLSVLVMGEWTQNFILDTSCRTWNYAVTYRQRGVFSFLGLVQWS